MLKVKAAAGTASLGFSPLSLANSLFVCLFAGLGELHLLPGLQEAGLVVFPGAGLSMGWCVCCRGALVPLRGLR